MRAFYEIALQRGGGWLMFGMLAVFVGQLFAFFRSFWMRRRQRYNVLLAVHAGIGFCLLVLILNGKGEMQHWERVKPRFLLSRLVFELPWVFIAAMELVGTAFVTITIINNYRYIKRNMTPRAIKETLDLLPVGVCFAGENGNPAFINLRMNEFGRRVLGHVVTNADELTETVAERGREYEGASTEGSGRNASRLVDLDTGETVLFTTATVKAGETGYRRLATVDVTEQARITAELAARNTKLREIQYRMKAYQVLAADMFKEQELLSARVAVHDGLGGLLLQCRYAFEHPGAVADAELLEMMRRTNRYLLAEAEETPAAEDRLEEALRTARGIGVRIVMTGEEPTEPKLRNILGLAIGECATNTVKHAGGERVDVVITADEAHWQAVITNDGDAPEAEVTESGGLLSLRRVTEDAGGTMRIECNPGFRLTLSVPIV